MDSPEPIRVLVVDDHHLFRAGLRALLAGQKDLAMSGEASTGREAFEALESAQPDVVTVDVTLPDGDGIFATREILKRRPNTRVLVLTMHQNSFYASQALAAGAHGYALKDQPPLEILDALRTVGRGEKYVAPQLPQELAEQTGSKRSRRAEGPFALLSPREREIFELIVRGHSNSATAEKLQLSIKTVETHRAHINKKLQVHSTGELIRLAALHGLVTI